MLTGLWGLVNNAGILYVLPIEWTPLDIFKRTADVNLWGMIDVTKTFLPLVKKARGRVVNFSSVAGKVSVRKRKMHVPGLCFMSTVFNYCATDTLTVLFKGYSLLKEFQPCFFRVQNYTVKTFKRYS